VPPGHAPAKVPRELVRGVAFRQTGDPAAGMRAGAQLRPGLGHAFETWQLGQRWIRNRKSSSRSLASINPR
jgi:hypothetical protein